MINARAQNAYGVAHFAQQNHVPQVRWENVDIIGDFIKNQMAKKQLEMMDKNYELAKDQAAFAREKFGYDQERDKVKDGQWQKEFDYKVIEADKNRKHDFDLEAVKNRNALGQISARQNAVKTLANSTNDTNSSLYYNAKNTALENLKKIEKLLETTDTSTDKGAKIANAYNKLYIDFNKRFGDPNKNLDPIEEQGKITAFMAEALKGEGSIF